MINCYIYIISYVTQFNLDKPSDDIDTVLRLVGKRIGALMKGTVIELARILSCNIFISNALFVTRSLQYFCMT